MTLVNRRNAQSVSGNVLGSGLMDPKQEKNVLKTFPSVVSPGCVENVMKTLQTVLKTLRGPRHGNAKNVFYVFVPRPKKNTET